MVAMPVYAPWPNSTCLAITVTLLSAPIRRNALGVKRAPAAGAAPTAAARRVEPAHSNPMVSAITLTVPALLRKARRVGCGGKRVWVFIAYVWREFAAAWIAARMRL